MTISGGLSKIVTGGASIILKRRDGIDRKALLRQNWDGPEPRVDTLDVRLVVEISACTGNSRRISLLEVFRLPNVKSYIYENNSLSEPSKNIFFEVVEYGFKAFKSAWQQDRDFKKAAINIIRQVLHELDQTGPVQANTKRLTAWFAGVEPDGFLFCNPFNWMKLLANSAQEVALLVLSSCCLEPTSTRTLCGNPEGAQNTGLKTMLKLSRDCSSALERIFHNDPWFPAHQHKEVKSSSDDKSRHMKFLRLYGDRSFSSTVLSDCQTRSSLPRPMTRHPTSGKVSGKGMATKQTSAWICWPLHARLDTGDGHKLLRLPHMYTYGDQASTNPDQEFCRRSMDRPGEIRRGYPRPPV